MPFGKPTPWDRLSIRAIIRSGCCRPAFNNTWYAMTINPSPANRAKGSLKALCTVGKPRRKSALSNAGMSSCTNDAQCINSRDTAAALVSSGASSPHALATARQSWGRILAPPEKTAWRIDACNRGGAPDPTATSKCDFSASSARINRLIPPPCNTTVKKK